MHSNALYYQTREFDGCQDETGTYDPVEEHDIDGSLHRERRENGENSIPVQCSPEQEGEDGRDEKS